MKFFPCLLGLLLVTGGCVHHSKSTPSHSDALALKQVIVLNNLRATRPNVGVPGRIDHAAYDPSTHRLFMAALENGSMEVIDTENGWRARSIPGLKQPQGAAIVPTLSCVVVACGGDDSVHVYGTVSLDEKAAFTLGADADNVRYDSVHNTVLICYGGTNSGGIAVMDALTWTRIREFTFSSKPESFQLDLEGSRLFVNLPGGVRATNDGIIAVMDLLTGKQITEIPLKHRARNFPMAFDAGHQRLFIACRRPARLLAIDTRTYQVIADEPCIDDSDDLFYDAKRNRVMVIGGGFRPDLQTTGSISPNSPTGEMGGVDLFSVNENGGLKRITGLASAIHARTGLFVPALDALYVFAPFQGTGEAQLLKFILKD